MKKMLVAVSAALVILLAGCGSKTPDGQTDKAAKTEGKVTAVITVQKQAEPMPLQAIGVVEARQEAELSFGMSGTITRMTVASGEQVRQGQLLAALDPGTDGSRDIQRLRLDDARRDLEKKKVEFHRSEQLYASGAIPLVDLQEDQREMEKAENELAQVAQNLAAETLTAPFSGTVVEVSQQAGETVVPGKTLMRLVDLSEVKITLDVAGDLIGQYRLGQGADIIREGAEISRGVVSSVTPVTDTKTGKYRVEIALDNAGGEWLGGMLAKVEVPRTLATGIVVPLSCVGMNQDQRYMLVVEDGVAKRRAVQVGQIMGDKIEILSGLKEGEQVISTGLSYIVEGEKIVAKGE